MATVKEIMDRAARRCSVTPPASWVNATDPTSMQLKDLLSETVEEILDRLDLPSPITQEVSISGTPEPHALPTDFKRLTRDPLTVYEKTTTRRAGVPVSSNGAWTNLVQIGSAGGSRYYRTAGDEADGFTIEFYRPLTAGDNVTVSYISKNWLKTSGGAAGEVWQNASDVLLLPSDIVRLGVVWRFKQRKGLAHTDVLAEYEARMARRINDARGIRAIDMTGGARQKAPWDVPVPDYIPSS